MKGSPASPQHPFKSKSFWHSLGYALSGLRLVLGSERNFRTHVLMSALVVGAGWYFQVTRMEWVALLLCMALMMAVEALNTSIEYLVDMLAGAEYNETAKRVKDISAGACLVTASGITIAGLLVFLPHLLAAIK